MADDDQPLLALAKKPSVKVDDDAPLAALASRLPSGKVKSPAGKKGAGKPTPKKKGGSSSSSSSSYSSTSSSDSEGKPKKGKAKAKAKAIKRKASMDPDAEPGDDGGGAVKGRERSAKEEVCANLLCRWWYSEPYLGKDWPPQEDSYYDEELAKNKLKRTTFQEWEWMPEEDDQGRRKVWELSQYRGIFRNSEGDVIDLRPKETCPCFNNFMAKDMSTLCAMLESAYENQLKDLQNCRYNNEKLKDELKSSITRTRHMAAQAAGLK